MTTYIELENESIECRIPLEVDGITGSRSFDIYKGKTRTGYEQGPEIMEDRLILDEFDEPTGEVETVGTGEFEQIIVEVDVYQELLDKEAAGEIEIQWRTDQEKQDKLDSDAIAESNRDVQQQIDELEKKSLRPARDLIADPSDADARVYFKEYNSQINVLRTQLIK